MDSKKGKKGNVSPALLSACAKNLPIDLRIIGEQPTTAYRSRFLSLTQTRKESVVVIEAPVARGSVVPIRPGGEAKVTFTLSGKENYFTTTVLGRGRYQLNPQTSVASLELRTPDDVLSEGIRSYYRITVEDTPSTEVRLGILADDEGAATRVRWRERGVLTDVGGGGLGFRILEGRSLIIRPGTRLTLRFRLREDDEEIKLVGRVCFSIRRPDIRRAFFGVQFIDVESEIEYKQDIDRILHFVAEVQRHSLDERRQSGE